ncbi:hypothetical protein [Enterobacter sp.]|nr:hypothetical protein [Enterobacter sp.]
MIKKSTHCGAFFMPAIPYLPVPGMPPCNADLFEDASHFSDGAQALA